VGGGCAGVAAAWHLSRQPGYEVHLYEKSWRLGGKGASVRDEDGRIRDHGLHVWLGFYENAFRMARDCYAEVQARGWGPQAASGHKLTHGCFEEAFFPEPHIGVAGKDHDGQWVVWSGHLPPAPGIPGDPIVPGSNPFTLANYILRCIELLKTLLVSVIGPPRGDDLGAAMPTGAPSGAIDMEFTEEQPPTPKDIIERLARGVRATTLTTAAAVLQTISILEAHLRGERLTEILAMYGVDRAVEVLRALLAQTREQLTDLVAIDPELRWKTEIIDIVMTITAGLVRDRVLFERDGLDAINREDYHEWLERHGATRSALDSRFLTGIYDFLFAYEGGDRERRSIAAGVALRGALRMFFTYRGAMFWRMRSGMGDAVFAPLYRVMLLDDRTAQGPPAATLAAVRFHFLHDLAGVKLDTDGTGRRFITELHFRTCGDPDHLDSCGDKALDEAGCWPDNPRHFGCDPQSPWTGRRTRTIGDDFDAVILAMSIEDLRTIGLGPPPNRPGTFLDAMPEEWRVMSQHVKTVATKAAQVWLKRDLEGIPEVLEGLGWHRGSVLVSALGQQFDTWADMTHTLSSERAWRKAMARTGSPADAARSVAYFCGTLPNDVAEQGPAGATAKVRADLDGLLTDGMQHFWPDAFRDGHTAAELVVGDCHVQANIGGSDRYVLSSPGSIDKRISPLEAAVANMTIAGDWTACGLDMGCIEAAVMSGMLAVHAISGDEPALESIVGYDHP
jgi:uncharacterized protein with NAD-binding domain and iron-sulfur cluster